jgi:hypothetical protein
MMCGNAAVPVATVMAPLPHPLVAPIIQQDLMGGPPVKEQFHNYYEKNSRSL